MKKMGLLFLIFALIALPCLAEESDIILDEAHFAAEILQIGANLETYTGKTLTMSGYVVLNSDSSAAPFCVYRDFNCCGGTDYTPYGFDCDWDGEIPGADTWVTVTGTIGRYTRANGYAYLLLSLSSLEEITPGNRIVYG